MPEPLEEVLSFDISAALQGISQLDDALQQVVATFQTALGDALIALSSAGSDVPPLADTLDVAGLTSSLDAALADALDAPRPLDVPVSADTAEAESAISALDTSVTPIVVEVDADTTSAQDDIDQLGTKATEAIGTDGGGGGGGSGLAGLEGAVIGVKAATGAAQGEVGGLTEAVGGLGEGIGTVIAGGAVFTGFLAETIHLAADAQAQQARFNATFGASADIVKNIDVGGLAISLEDLGKKSGTTNADLEASATRIGLLGTASGAAQPLVAKTAGDLLGLAGALAVSNPRFGDAATVADTLSRALSTGRTRSLIPYGISLSQVQIQQEALTEAHKTDASTLTGYEKLVAGLTLALQQQGDTLGTKFTAGAQNAQIELRALKTELEETLVAAGGPLLKPVVDSLQSVLPVAEEVGTVLGNLGQVVLPVFGLVAHGLGLITAPLGLVGDGLHALAAGGPLVAIGLGAVTTALTVGTDTLYAYLSAEALVSEATLLLGNPFVAAGLAIGALGFVVDSFSGHAKTAAVDTTALDQAFTQTQDAAASLSSVVGGLNNSIDEYLKKQLAVKIQGDTELSTANATGLSYEQLSNAIQGTASSYDAIVDRIKNVRDVQIEATRAQTQTGNAIGEDALKREQGIAAIDKTDASYRNLLKTLEDGRQKLEDNAHFTLDSAVAAGSLSDAQLKAAVAATTAGGKSADYLSVLKQFASVIDAATAKQNAATNAAALSGQAYTTLAGEIAAGTKTAADAADLSTQLGISTQDATTFINDQTTALTANKDAHIEASAAALGLVRQLQLGDITTAEAQADFANLGLSIGSIASFTSQAQTAVTTFTATLDGALPSTSDAIGTFQKNIDDAWNKVVDDVSKGTGHVKDDLKALAIDQDPQRFVDGLNAQTVQIAKFSDNLRILIAEGFTPLANALAQKGPEAAAALASGLASAPSKAKAASAAEELKQAVTDRLNGLAPELVAGADASGATIGKSFSDGAARAILENPAIIFSGQQLGQKTVDAFKPPIADKAREQVQKAADLIPTLVNLPNVTGILGVDAGEAFGQGLANGMSEKNSAVSDAAGALASTADTAVKRRLGIQSPSTVGIALGQQFVSGIAVGIGNSISQVATSSSAFAKQLIAEMNAALAAASQSSGPQTAAQLAFSSFLSTATSVLPSASSAISKFSQDIATAQANQTTSLTAYHAAFKTYADDLTKQQKLSGDVSNANVLLAAAQANLTEVLAATPAKGASAAQKQALAEAKSAVSTANSLQLSFLRQFDHATDTTAQGLAAVGTAAKDLTAAQKALAGATNASTFVSDLNKQTQASQRFGADLAKLTKEGFGDLAKQLADAGVDTAGKLADELASNKAKAKTANAAVDAASNYASAFSKELTDLFGGGAAASTAVKAGTATGNALVSGFKTSLATGLGPASIAKALQVGVPAVNQSAVPQLAIPTLAGSQTQSLSLDLTIVLPDGSTLNASTDVTIPKNPTTLNQRVMAEIHAS